MIFTKKQLLSAVLIAIFSFSVGAMIFSFPRIANGSGNIPKESPTKETTSKVTIKGKVPANVLGTNTIADMVEHVGSAVVNIDVTKMTKKRVITPFKNFEEFFGFQMNPNMKDFYQDKLVPIKGSGSGFIIDDKGYIITNEHVVNGATKITVKLRDGRSIPAKLIGSDKTLDIAIIKINASKIPYIKMGNSDNIRVGEWVVAIGNPYEFSNSVTLGIISAMGRSLNNLGKKDLIQTDAAINPGNSGGPLLNLQGEVIGINVAIAAQAQNIGFAIPINSAKEILNDLIKHGKVSRPWVGIYMRDVDKQIAEYFKLPSEKGVIITDVIKNSPAEKAGLKKYDVIREMDRKEIKNSLELKDIVSKLKVGDKALFLVYRNGATTLLTMKVGSAP